MSDEHRLPRTAVPEHYDISLAPDLATATFSGRAAVELVVQGPTDVLVCNAAELDIGAAWLVRRGERLDLTSEPDEGLERVTFRLPEALEDGEEVVLHIGFTGVLNDKLRGFYRSTFEDDDGATRNVAVTQFEATDARRAFPCWDEPEYKATFSVHLDVAPDLLAISNGPEIDVRALPDGRVRRSFATTMKMSTYLVAFVVGPLETSRTVDVDGTALRIVHRPGQQHLAELALEVGAFALRYLADYYGIVYPGDKMDMVAVPDFAFGAMENLGCVVYRENLLLVDPASATQSELQAVVDVIAHELAHMWFGDLVTMSWWNGIWLNEAFATFMEMKCTDAYRPDWQRWQYFGRERTTAFDVDALASTRPVEYEVRSPADAEGMFDTLTYQKGSAVVRMLEQYLGEDAFRDGIHRYLQTHQFANTETADLWRALEAETGEPVEAVMESWIFQGGFPLVAVQGEGSRLRVGQERFQYAGTAQGTLWQLPLVLRALDGTAHRLVLDDRETATDRPGGADSTVVANAGGHGFYRVLYDADLDARLVARLAELAPLERFAFLDDRIALTRRGDRTGGELAGSIVRLAEIGEEDLAVWQLAATAIDLLHRSVDDADRDAWSAWVRATLRPVAEMVGFEPSAGEDDRRRALRGVLLQALGSHGDAEVLDRLRAALEASWADPTTVDAEVAAAALRAVAVHADSQTYDQILARQKTGETPQEQNRHLYAGAAVRDPGLFDRYLALLASDEVRSQNLGLAAAMSLRNLDNAAAAWSWIRGEWDRLEQRLPFNATRRLFEGATTIGDRTLAEEIERFVAERDFPGSEQLIEQSLELMRVQVALRERESPRLIRDLP